MTKFFAVLVAGALLAMTGCHDNDHKHHDDMSKPKMMMATDACAKCPGVQTVTADGKCSGCGAMVTDVCSHCPGVQVATADGKCSSCGMAVK